MNEEKFKPFRGLDDDFMRDLKDEGGILNPILKFERKHRKSFMVEIRNNFLDLYFLGHGIEVRRRHDEYFLIASEKFIPKQLSSGELKNAVKSYGNNRWQISFDELRKNSISFNDIMTSILSKIVEHKRGNISEGVSEINHFIDNRAIRKNGILIIDRQVVYPKSKEGRLDLLGLKRLKNDKFTFVVLELKNKNNRDIANVFTNQLRRYIDLVYKNYEHFRITYEEVLKQKIKLSLLTRIKCRIAPEDKIKKSDIEGLVILDNYNIRSDLKDNGLLRRALDDWKELKKMSGEYNANLFFKTNVLDSSFFMDDLKTEYLLKNYRRKNLG